MPSVKGIYHRRDRVDIDFTVPIAGLARVGDVSRLTIPNTDLTPTKLDAKLAPLNLHNFNRYGFKVGFVDDPSVPPNTLLKVVDKEPPHETDLIMPHNTTTFLDGFESRDFGPWIGTLGGQAEVQTGTLIDGDFTAHFGFSGGPGSDQGDCTARHYASTGAVANQTRSYIIFRIRITALAAAASGDTTICNVVDGSSGIPHLLLTEDGKIKVFAANGYTGSTVLSLDTTYWFGLYLEIDSGNDGWIEGRVWNDDGSDVETVGIRSPDTSEDFTFANWNDIHIGVTGNNTPCEVYIDSVIADNGTDWPERGKVSKTLFPTDQSSTDDQWTTQAPGSGEAKWEDVDDLRTGTVVDTIFVGHTIAFLGGTKTQGFVHRGFSDAGIPSDATIHAVLNFPRYRRVSGGTNAKTRLRQGSSTQETNTTPPTSMAWQSPLVRDTHPDGAAWSTKTPSDLDSVEPGMHLLDSFTGPVWELAALHFSAYYVEAAAVIPNKIVQVEQAVSRGVAFVTPIMKSIPIAVVAAVRRIFIT